MNEPTDTSDLIDDRRPAPSDDSAIAPPSPAPAEIRLPPTDAAPSAPIGGTPQLVKTWFDGAAAAARPDPDGTLAGAHASARSYRGRAKADNTRAAYRSAVRAWCAWCATHGLTPLPASAPDVAAFLADERDRGLAANTLDLRRAAIRFLHRAAGLAVARPTTPMSPRRWPAFAATPPIPTKKRAATLTVLRELLAPIPTDLRGLRDRALLLVGFAGALRRSELAGIRMADLERTDHGFQLTLPRSKGSQTAAAIVPLPYGQTELCPVRALTQWLDAAGINEGAVFRRLWLPPLQCRHGRAPSPTRPGR